MRTKKWIGGFIRRGVYWLDRRANGQRFRFSLRVLTLRAALAELERFELDPERYVAGSAGGYPLERAIADYLVAARQRLTQKHVYTQVAALERWRVALNFGRVVVLEQVTPAHAEEFIRWRREGGYRDRGKPVGASMVNQDLFALKALFRWARETERLPEGFNPLRKVRQLKVKGGIRPHRPVPRDQILAVRDELVERAPGWQWPPHEHPWPELVTLLYGSALRYDSAVRVEVVESESKVRAPQKGTDWVEVSVAPEVLQAALACAGTTFPRDSGQQLNHRLQVACEAAGVPRFTVHDLRVSAATHLHRAGMSLRQLQKLLGHANITTTQLYVRADEVLQGPSLEPPGPVEGRRLLIRRSRAPKTRVNLMPTR